MNGLVLTAANKLERKFQQWLMDDCPQLFSSHINFNQIESRLTVSVLYNNLFFFHTFRNLIYIHTQVSFREYVEGVLDLKRQTKL